MPIHVGTCGWNYRHWRGVFYPPEVPQRSWLAYYAERFATVELDNSFYRLPAYETFARWRDQVPEDFVVALKASRYLTHIKRLRDPREPVERLVRHARGLGDRLGPILLQLPPTLRADAGLLAECLDAFPADVRVSVEPRHPSWWTSQVRRVLEDRQAALAWTDRLGRPLTPLWRTAGWGYLRCHEGRAVPWPRYGQAALRAWIRRIAEAFEDAAEVFVYFNNDPGGAAVLDAVAFARAANRAGRSVSRTFVER
ncbi:DUF72 domain-containing protein [Thermasporomyces composti]|uniref:Uncharacterized protein YecE (DUF72 family) n=1 Tax=Thermasporomyces composti TaxID=696763 RepID=A0A3D9V824_THECX|nr:DUF72 domain-containing protein [Thermasporomyces composti]REF37948.1 uncharacterized protein YecE (DUF72 family) [Thermasporomyces composti]